MLQHGASFEDFPMTFQIGLVGTDGVLLGSDKLMTLMGSVRSTYEAEKIAFYEPGLAMCSCGGDLAAAMRDPIIDVVRSFSPGRADFRGDLISKCQMFLLDMLDKGFDKNSISRQAGAVLFARRTNECVELWRMIIGMTGSAMIGDAILDKITQGDETNPARFFCEQYYKEGRTVAELIPLAVHSLLMAHERNLSGVNGVEIAICKSTEFRKLLPEEIRKLRENSEDLDEHIASRLGLPRRPPTS